MDFWQVLLLLIVALFFIVVAGIVLINHYFDKETELEERITKLQAEERRQEALREYERTYPNLRPGGAGEKPGSYDE
jgi:hypothetical protein